MLKKIGLIMSLIFCAAPLWADSVHRVEISIKNMTASDCVLKKQFLVHGHISDHTAIPEVIFRDQVGVFSMRGNPSDHGAASLCLFLTYECGEGHTITLLSERHRTKIFIYPKVFESENMDATYSHYDGNGFAPSTPAELHWTLRDK